MRLWPLAILMNMILEALMGVVDMEVDKVADMMMQMEIDRCGRNGHCDEDCFI